MNEQDLNRLLDGSPEIQADRAFQEKVKKEMRRTLIRRTVITLLIILLAGTILFFSTSALLNCICYDPADENGTFLLSCTGGVQHEFHVLLEDAVAILCPGTRLQVLDRPEATGFGHYELAVQTENAFLHTMQGALARYTFRLSPAGLDTDHAPLVCIANCFANPTAPDRVPAGIGTEALMPELQKLPQSARLDIALSLESALTAQQTADLMRAYPDITFHFLALNGQEAAFYPGVSGGLPLDSFRSEVFTQEAAKKYPNYVLPEREALTGEVLQQSLCSRLQLLLDHPDFLRLLEPVFPEIATQKNLTGRLEQAKTEFTCYGLWITAGTQDLQKLLQDYPCTQILVNDVKVSRYAR